MTLILLLSCAVGLSGCVYLRLLEVKHQLADFDAYFHVEADKRFVLHFKQPVLYSGDFVYLSELYPTEEQRLAEGKRWRYVMHEMNAAGGVAPSSVPLDVDMQFDGQDRLVAWGLSPAFLAMVPAEFLEISLRSLGGAEVDQAKQQVKANPASLPKTRFALPRRDALVAVLGQPLDVVEVDPVRVYFYRFELDSRLAQDEHPERRITEVRLYFDRKTDELLKTWIRLAGMKVAIDYRRLVEKETPQFDF